MLMLKEIRLEKGYSIPKLVELSGVSRRTIQDLEKRGDGRISTLRILADALDVSLDDIYPKEETR